MEFSCPDCGTPHAFPDDQIPATGIVVACTKCARHITLTPPAPPKPMAPPPPSPPAPPPPSAFDLKPAPSFEPPKPSSQPALEPKPAVAPPPSFEPPKQEPPKQEPPKQEPDFLDQAAKGVGVAADAVSDKAKKVAEKSKRLFDAAAGEAIAPEKEVPKGLAFPGFAPTDDRWTWRDLPTAFVGLFDVRRLLFTTAGLWVALCAYGLLDWVGGFLGGILPILGTIMSVAAWGALVGGFAVVASVMGHVLHKSVVERAPTTIGEGIAWTKSWLKSVVGTPLAFVAVVAAVAVVEAGVGMIGRIPFIGPIVWGVVSPAIVVLSLIAGAVLLALLYCIPLYVPVIYNEKTSPVETLRRLLNLFKTHGFSLVGYVLLSKVTLAVVGLVTIFPIWTAACSLTVRVGAQSMGPNLAGLLAKVPSGFQLFSNLMVPGLGFFGADTGFGHTLGGIFAALGTTLGVALILSLFALVYFTAGCIIYSIITDRKK